MWGTSRFVRCKEEDLIRLSIFKETFAMNHSNFPPFCFCYCLCAGGFADCLPASVFLLVESSRRKELSSLPLPAKYYDVIRSRHPNLPRKTRTWHNCPGCCLVCHHWQKRSHLPSSTVQPQTRPLSPSIPSRAASEPQTTTDGWRPKSSHKNPPLVTIHTPKKATTQLLPFIPKLVGLDIKLKINWRFWIPYSLTNCPGLIPKKVSFFISIGKMPAFVKHIQLDNYFI